MPKGRKPNTSLTFLKQIDPCGGQESCWPWLGFKNPKGYGQSCLNNKTMLAHRWSYQHHYGIVIPKNMCVLHACDNPSCCNPLHLSLGTNQDNVNEKMKRGRFVSKQSRFTQEQLNQMKQMRLEGATYFEIGVRFKCSRTTVSLYARQGFLKTNVK